jgi:hypothetical protein
MKCCIEFFKDQHVYESEREKTKKKEKTVDYE